MNTGHDFLRLLLRSDSEVIQIGIDRAQIGEVASDSVEYVDSSGQERVIDLRECAGNWVRLHLHRCFPAPQHFVECFCAENRCIGLRGSRWVKFMNRQKTLFEFPTQVQWREFIGSLDKAGWRTFDSDSAGKK